MNITMKYAVNYVEQHLSVIPLAPGTKDQPLVKWREYQIRLPTMKELESWFSHTQNNIAIITGPISDLSVLDVDELKNLPQVSSPITVITKRGKHLYFAYSGEQNSVSKIAKSIDTRGTGGFVCAPPSIVDGHRYRFINPIFSTSRLPAFPKHLLEGEKNVNPTSSTGGTGNGQSNHKPDNWLSEALGSLKEGNRNSTFTAIVGRLHRDRHSPDDIRSFLLPHATACGFELDELETVIQSVIRYKNQTFGKSGEGYLQHSAGDKAENLKDFLQGEETVDWIVPQAIAKGTIGFITGLPKVKKTWVAVDLAIEAARGGYWLGHKVAKTKTLMIDQERPKVETRRRFNQVIAGKGLNIDDLAENLIVQSKTTTRLNLDESFEAFRQKLAEIRPGLLILDSFRTFHTVSQNESSEIQKVLERIKQLREEFGCAILFISHENKSVLNPDNAGEVPTAFRMEGSVAIPAAAETIFVVRAEKDNKSVLYHTEATVGKSIAPITFKVEDTNNGGVVIEVLGRR